MVFIRKRFGKIFEVIMQTLTLVRINTELHWECHRTESGNWVAVCHPLNVTVQSETWAELMEDMADTVDAILQDLLISHELPRFLREHGWEAVGPLPEPDGAVRFDIPFIPAIMSSYA